jgi:cyclohexanone monooxygenase
VNFPHLLNEQSRHVAYIVKHALDSDLQSVEATQEAEDEWVATIIRLSRFSRDFLEQCTPGYYNNEGGGDGGIRSALGEPYGYGFYAFEKLLREWRERADLEGLVLR